MFLVSVSSIPFLKHLQFPSEKGLSLSKIVFTSQREIFKRDSHCKLMSYGLLTVKHAQTKVTSNWAVSMARLHYVVSLPFLTFWSNTPCSRPAEDVLYYDIWPSSDNWFILTNCLQLSPPSYRDQPDPREKRYASIWISSALKDKSVLCMDVLLTGREIQKDCNGNTLIHTQNPIGVLSIALPRSRFHCTPIKWAIDYM